MKTALLLLVLVIGQTLLRPSTEASAGRTLAARFPGAVGAMLFSGFRPFVLQYLYLEFRKAVAEGRTVEAMADGRLLQRMDPYNPGAAQFLTWVIVYDLAAAERTTTGRLKRILQGLDLNQAASERMPRDARFPRDRALILHQTVALEPGLAAAYLLRRGREAALDAGDAWLEAIRLAPMVTGLRDSWLALTLDFARVLLGRGDRAGAERLLDEARERAETWQARISKMNLHLVRAWAQTVASLGQGAALAAEALGELERALALVPLAESAAEAKEELAVWGLLLSPLLEQAALAARAGRDAAALSLLEALHSIQVLTRNRLAQREPEGIVEPPTADYEARWREALAGLSARDAATLNRVRRLGDPWKR